MLVSFAPRCLEFDLSCMFLLTPRPSHQRTLAVQFALFKIKLDVNPMLEIFLQKQVPNAQKCLLFNLKSKILSLRLTSE